MNSDYKLDKFCITQETKTICLTWFFNRLTKLLQEEKQKAAEELEANIPVG